MEIKSEPCDVVFAKLSKLRCCTGCLNNINYLVFRHGLYCSTCLSTLPDLTNDHFINLEALSKIMADFAVQYGEKNKGQLSQLNLIKGEMESLRKQVKKSKDSLSYDIKTVKEKSIASLDELYTECLKENQNQALQAFYEPDITASLIINESQLLVQNLNNLRVCESQEGKIEYKLQEGLKNPQRINKKIQKQYNQLDLVIQEAQRQCSDIIGNFLKEIKPLSVQNV